MKKEEKKPANGGRDRQLNKNPMGYIHGTVRSAQVISVIRTESRTGAGTEENPNRIVTQYWSTDGELLAVHDPLIQEEKKDGEIL